jgi:hypothetical protein
MSVISLSMSNPGGGGPKSRLLEAVMDEHDLHGQVTLEGPVPHERACEFLVRGKVRELVQGLVASCSQAFLISHRTEITNIF